MGSVEARSIAVRPKEILQRLPENTYHLMRSGKEVIDNTIDRISQAKYSIDLQYYTFEADETGERVIQALLDAKQKAKAEGRDLPIRLLADNSINMFHDGKSTWFSKKAREKRDATYTRLLALQDEGIEVKITNYFHFLGFRGNPWYRDHKKIAIFDSQNPDVTVDPKHSPTVLLGSANISNEHYRWKEICVEMNGNMVASIQKDFNETFEHARAFSQVLDVPTVGDYIRKNIFHKPQKRSNLFRDAEVSVVRNVETPGWRKTYDLKIPGDGKGGIIATDGDWHHPREASLLAIEQIRSLGEGDRIDTGAPFPGMYRTTKEMLNAQNRHVDVHLFTSDENSYHLYDRHRKIAGLPVPNPVAASWETKIKSGGIKLHIYQGEKGEVDPTLHAKFMLIRRKDGTATVWWGSSNLNWGIFAGMDREIVMMTDDPKIVSQFIDLVDNDLAPHSILQKNGWRRTKAA